jgi:hypothetical protein
MRRVIGEERMEVKVGRDRRGGVCKMAGRDIGTKLSSHSSTTSARRAF